MGYRFRRLSALCCAAVLSAAAAACSSPTAPSRLDASVPPSGAPPPVAVRHWPVPHPDGEFGHEDPAYPPEQWQCPPGYDVLYNGWNFVCDDPNDYDREMPRPEGYPDDWKPGDP
jgi:hypothetical protein